MHTVHLKRGREKSLQRRHPWLYSGALKEPGEEVGNGETVHIANAQGDILALGAYSPHSQIRVRLWSYSPDEQIDSEFFRRRLEQAVSLRRRLLPAGNTACRLVNSESDGLPGLVVDRYGDFLVCQFLSAGAEYFRRGITVQLQDLLSPRGIYERSDVDVRLKEGLELRAGVIAGEEPPELTEIAVDGTRLLVDVRRGHKTGFYLDQCVNYEAIRGQAQDAEVLNCFAYTGAFGFAALQGGAAAVTNVESSAEALRLAARNAELNGIGPGRIENVQDDCFDALRRYRDAGRKFDMVILDPPKFVRSAQQLKQGSRGYKDINMIAMKLLKRDGILVTFSCSGHVSQDLFQKIVADAALDAEREAGILRFLSQSPDHPVALNFPEGRYLKGLVCAVRT